MLCEAKKFDRNLSCCNVATVAVVVDTPGGIAVQSGRVCDGCSERIEAGGEKQGYTVTLDALPEPNA